jgi:hypothetical protein
MSAVDDRADVTRKLADKERLRGPDTNPAPFLYAEHVRQLGGASPVHNVMDVK